MTAHADERASTVERWHAPRMTETLSRDLLFGRRRAVMGIVVVLALAACAFTGFAAGRGSSITSEDVRCLSAEGAIMCTLKDG